VSSLFDLPKVAVTLACFAVAFFMSSPLEGQQVEKGVHPLSHPDVSTLAFAPDGQVLVSAGKGGMRVWSMPEGQYVRTLTIRDELPDGSRHRFTDIEFLSDGTTLLASANDGTITFWDLKRGVLLSRISEPWLFGDMFHYQRLLKVPISSIALTTDEQFVVGSLADTVAIWSVTKKLHTGNGAQPARVTKVKPLEIVPDDDEGPGWDDFLANYFDVGTLDASSPKDRLWQIWDIGLQDTNSIRDIAFVQDSNLLLVAHVHCTEAWDMVSNKQVRAHRGWTCFAVSPDGSVMAGGGVSHPLEFVETSTGTRIRSVELFPTAVEFSRNKDEVFVADESFIYVLDAHSGTQLEKYPEGPWPGELRVCEISADGKVIATSWSQLNQAHPNKISLLRRKPRTND
jgi:WD40 repeat protein